MSKILVLMFVILSSIGFFFSTFGNNDTDLSSNNIEYSSGFIESSYYTKDVNIQNSINAINMKIELIYKKSPDNLSTVKEKIKQIYDKSDIGEKQQILLIAILDRIEYYENYNNKQLEQGGGNTFNDSFSKSKKMLENYVYNGEKIARKSYYCTCEYRKNKSVIKDSCGFKDNGKYVSRSNYIEWEHIVAAESFGQSFKEWREGDPNCIDTKGKKFKGRNCAEKVNSEYRYMQSDMYNLVPSIGSINALRSNYSFSEIPGENREFGLCDFEIEKSKAEPKDEIKGDIARIYMYMENSYPGHGIISNKNKKMFDVWNNLDPISKEECIRYKTIKSIQLNENFILKTKCSDF